MGLFKKKDKKTEKELEKLPLKELERAMPLADEEEEPEEEEKAEKDMSGASRKGQF